MSSSSGCGLVGCGQTSATWLPSTMPSPPSTRPSGSRERRSSAFVREDSGVLRIHLVKVGAVASLPHRKRELGLSRLVRYNFVEVGLSNHGVLLCLREMLVA